MIQVKIQRSFLSLSNKLQKMSHPLITSVMKVYNCNTASPLEVVVNLETEANVYTIKGLSQRVL